MGAAVALAERPSPQLAPEAPVIDVEPWTYVRAHIAPLWRRHYAEIADHRIPLDPDWTWYDAMARADRLHVVTVRLRGVLIGYLFAIVGPHPHYRSTLFAAFDLFWLDPAHRRGWTGVRLFREAERTLRARGVRKLVSHMKLAHDVAPIFARLGWDETERVHTKYLRD